MIAFLLSYSLPFFVSRKLVYATLLKIASLEKKTCVVLLDIATQDAHSWVVGVWRTGNVVTKTRNDLQPPKATYNHAPRKIEQPPTTNTKTFTTTHKQSITILNKP